MENKTNAVASLLGALAMTDYGRKISNIMYIEDQKRAMVIFRDSSFYNVPTKGDALDVIGMITDALREKRDAEKNRD